MVMRNATSLWYIGYFQCPLQAVRSSGIPSFCANKSVSPIESRHKVRYSSGRAIIHAKYGAADGRNVYTSWLDPLKRMIERNQYALAAAIIPAAAHWCRFSLQSSSAARCGAAAAIMRCHTTTASHQFQNECKGVRVWVTKQYEGEEERSQPAFELVAQIICV